MPLLGVNSFPAFTATRLGLPSTADLSEEIDRYLERAWDDITSAIGEEAVTSLTDTATTNQERRRRFRDAYRSLVESRLWSTVARATANRVGTQRQGGRSMTVDASAVSTAAESAAEAYERYVDVMLALGYSVRAIGSYASEVERA